METFRLRETKEFLSIDELKEKCDTMDVFMDILKVRQGANFSGKPQRNTSCATCCCWCIEDVRVIFWRAGGVQSRPRHASYSEFHA